VALCCVALWLATAKLVRISSVATLVPMAASPLLALVFSDTEHALMALLVGVLVFWKHEGNIRRLMAGTEPRIGETR
jgi:glycerol-3-phosphate acyltransferase PlsY